MEEFLLFFLSIFVFFIIMNKLYKKGEVLSIKSSIDNRTYIVRKLPDAKMASDKLATVNKDILRLIGSLDEHEKEGILDLQTNYNPNTVSETLRGSKYTSYSVNKGEKLSLCIRKEDDTFIDHNTIIFVVIRTLFFAETILVETRYLIPAMVWLEFSLIITILSMTLNKSVIK